MKSEAIQKEIKSFQKSLSKDSTLYKFLVALSDEVSYMTENLKDGIPRYHLQNIMKEITQQTYISAIIFFQHLQKLDAFHGQYQEDLLEFLESIFANCKNNHNIHLNIYQLYSTLIDSSSIRLDNLIYSIKCLRFAQRLFKQTNNQVLKLSIFTQIESIVMHLGRSARLMLCENEAIKDSITNFILLFSGIIDGEINQDFDVLFSLRAINVFFEQLRHLLILLDPIIVGVIKQNLSAQLKKLIAQQGLPLNQLQQCFKSLEILLMSNPNKFIDCLDTLKKYLFTEQHSHQKTLSFKVLVQVAKEGTFLEILRDDGIKDEVADLFQKLTKYIKSLNDQEQPHQLQQLEQAIGNIITIEQMYQGISTNKFVLTQSALFNSEFSESIFQSNIKLPIIMQECVRKQLKFLLHRVELSKIVGAFFYYSYTLDLENTEKMIQFLFEFDNPPNILIKIIVETIFAHKGQFSQDIWNKFFILYFNQSDQEIIIEMKQLIQHNFDDDVLDIMIKALLDLQDKNVTQFNSIFLQFFERHFNRLQNSKERILIELYDPELKEGIDKLQVINQQQQ